MKQSAPMNVKGGNREGLATAQNVAHETIRAREAGRNRELHPAESSDPLHKRQTAPISVERDASAPTASAAFIPSSLASITRRLAAMKDGNGKPSFRRNAISHGISEMALARSIEASEARMASLIDQVAQRQERAEAHIASLIDAIVDGFAITSPLADSEPEDAGDADADDLDNAALDFERGAMVPGALDEPPQSNKETAGEAPADHLSEQIAALTREIAELRRGHHAMAGEGGLATLRADITALGEQIAGLVPSGQFALIDRKLDLLARQVQDPTVLASIQRETADIRRSLVDLGRAPDLSGVTGRLEQRLDSLQAAIEKSQNATNASLVLLTAQLERRPDDNLALTALEQQIKQMAVGLETAAPASIAPAIEEAFAKSSLHSLPDELRRLFAELRSFQMKETTGTQKTLDALQATLHLVAGRLAAIEDLARTRSPSAFAGDGPPLFGRERPDDFVWSDDLPRSLAGDAPASEREASAINPAPRPSQVSASGNEARNSFIAAARRASRAAAEADGSLARDTDRLTEARPEPFYQRHKRSILLGLAAISMMLGALQAGHPVSFPHEEDPRGSSPSAKLLSAPAGHQNSRAQSLYEEARNIDQAEAATHDLAKAAALYRQAAGLGHPSALYRLGVAYDKGRGVGHDAVLAGLWYQRAAEHGVVKAMYNLAVLYATGTLMGAPDYQQSARWFRQAADLGHAASQYNFALLAAQGSGMRSDLATAHYYMALAAEQGDGDALNRCHELAQALRA